MASFDDRATTTAPPEEVWKLLYDPSRFPEWWAGIASVERRAHEGRGDYTMFPEGHPDFPMAQRLSSEPSHGSVFVSCLVSELAFEWRLTPEDGGTRIDVYVDVPEREAHRLDAQRSMIAASLRNLAALATGAPRARG